MGQTSITLKMTTPSWLRSTYQIWPTGQSLVHASSQGESFFGNASLVYNSDPDWKQKVSRRQQAATFYQREGLSGSIRPAVLLASSTTMGLNAPYNCSSRYIGAALPTPGGPVLDSVLRDIALTRLKRKLRRHTEFTKSLVTIFELKDLKSLVPSLVDLTTDLVGTLADIKRTRGRSAYRYASKAWLTYGFGIRPALEDFQGHLKAVASHLTRNDHMVRLAGSAKKDWTGNMVSPNQTFNRLASLTSQTAYHQELSYRFVAGFLLNFRSGNNYDLGERFGTTLPNLIPSLWEATALSWIVDYFTNVGDFLEDTFVAPAGNTIYVVENRRYRVKMEGRSFPVPNANTVVQYRRDGSYDFTYFQFTRTPLPSLPHSGLRFRTVEEVGNFGVTKLLNLVSLFKVNEFGDNYRFRPVTVKPVTRPSRSRPR